MENSQIEDVQSIVDDGENAFKVITAPTRVLLIYLYNIK